MECEGISGAVRIQSFITHDDVAEDFRVSIYPQSFSTPTD